MFTHFRLIIQQKTKIGIFCYFSNFQDTETQREGGGGREGGKERQTDRQTDRQKETELDR